MDRNVRANLTDAEASFLVDFRRDLHMHPELAWEEHRTAAKVAGAAREAGLEVREGVAGTLGIGAKDLLVHEMGDRY